MFCFIEQNPYYSRLIYSFSKIRRKLTASPM